MFLSAPISNTSHDAFIPPIEGWHYSILATVLIIILWLWTQHQVICQRNVWGTVWLKTLSGRDWNVIRRQWRSDCCVFLIVETLRSEGGRTAKSHSVHQTFKQVAVLVEKQISLSNIDLYFYNYHLTVLDLLLGMSDQVFSRSRLLDYNIRKCQG